LNAVLVEIEDAEVLLKWTFAVLRKLEIEGRHKNFVVQRAVDMTISYEIQTQTVSERLEG
jgi:hypothetical protein